MKLFLLYLKQLSNLLKWIFVLFVAILWILILSVFELKQLILL